MSKEKITIISGDSVEGPTIAEARAELKTLEKRYKYLSCVGRDMYGEALRDKIRVLRVKLEDLTP